MFLNNGGTKIVAMTFAYRKKALPIYMLKLLCSKKFLDQIKTYLMKPMNTAAIG
jgi:uncharacterized protein (DUF111 family)